MGKKEVKVQNEVGESVNKSVNLWNSMMLSLNNRTSLNMD